MGNLQIITVDHLSNCFFPPETDIETVRNMTELRVALSDAIHLCKASGAMSAYAVVQTDTRCRIISYFTTR